MILEKFESQNGIINRHTWNVYGTIDLYTVHNFKETLVYDMPLKLNIVIPMEDTRLIGFIPNKIC